MFNKILCFGFVTVGDIGWRHMIIRELTPARQIRNVNSVIIIINNGVQHPDRCSE